MKSDRAANKLLAERDALKAQFESSKMIFSDLVAMREERDALRARVETLEWAIAAKDKQIIEYSEEVNKRGARVAQIERDCEMLNGRIDQLEEALSESVKIQSHYARLLNSQDGGKRIGFAGHEAWLEWLAIKAKEAK